MTQLLSDISKTYIYNSLFESTSDGIAVLDNEKNIIQTNEAAEEFFLLNDFDYTNEKFFSFISDHHLYTSQCQYESPVKGIKDKYVEIREHQIKYDDEVHGSVVVFRDITERKNIEKLLLEEKECSEIILKCMNDAVMISDVNGMIKYLNPVAEAFTGWTDAEAHGLPLSDVFAIFDGSTRCPLPDPVAQCLREGRVVERAHYSLLICRDQRERAIEYITAPLRERHGLMIEPSAKIVGAVLAFRDVSDIVGMTRQMVYQTGHDTLTGLRSRQAFETCLGKALDSAKRERAQHVLCYLDLDQFKVVNDTCGHRAGDHLLRQLTTLLYASVRSTDMLSRLGGDEFGIILQNCSMDTACQVAENLRRAIKDFRFTWHEKSFHLGVSIGLVPITATTRHLPELLSAADFACYTAKEQGRNRMHVYQPDDKAVTQRHGEMQWVHRISRALAEGRFCLYQQSIVALSQHEAGCVHAEVLLRMVDEQGDLVPPMAFIPAAERYNLMPAIDRWVVRQTLETMAQERRAETSEPHLVPPILAINLSGQSLGDNGFREFVIAQLQQSGVSGERICFEITETAAIANLSRAIQFIVSLREIGCRFALDDFGSGLSSFAYLKKLPVDYLKIDGSFVKGMLEDPIDTAMVKSINQIGHVMGIQTIAEFVENDAIISRLKTIGVDYAQGYAIDKPKPLEPALSIVHTGP